MRDELLALAAHDAAIAKARHDLEHPPSVAAMQGATAELATLAGELRALEAQRDPLATQAAALERDGSAARARAALLDERLAEATGAGRELEAMQEERASQLSRASHLDDVELEVLEQLGPLDEAVASTRERGRAVAARRAAAEASLGEERAGAEASLAALLGERPGLAAALDPTLLARYDAIAARTKSSGAAMLVEGRCGGCHVTVPAMVADQLRHAVGDDAVAVCDECGRLLVA